MSDYTGATLIIACTSIQGFISKKEHEQKQEDVKSPTFLIDEDNKSDLSLNGAGSGRRYLNSDGPQDDENDSLIMSVER